MNGIKHYAVMALAALWLAGCGGKSGGGNSDSTAVVNSLTVSGIEVSMPETLAVGSSLSHKIQINSSGAADSPLPALTLTGNGSEYFNVTINATGQDGEFTGSVSLNQSLLGLINQRFELTATASLGDVQKTADVILTVSEGHFSLPTIQQEASVQRSVNTENNALPVSPEISVALPPQHGTAKTTLIGGETWDFSYTSTECYEGADRYYYQQGQDYGKVTVVVSSPIVNKTLQLQQGQTRVIELDAAAAGGSIEITQPANGSSSYNSDTRTLSYTPAQGFVGNDSFNYSYNGCPKVISLQVAAPPQIFRGSDIDHGKELWITDGTAAATQLLKDIFPGVDSSLPAHITAKGDNQYFFVANDDIHKGELWITDTTADGTRVVKDIHPEASTTKPDNLNMLNGTLYFLADGDNDYDRELWKSDGTEENTVLVKDLNSNAGYMRVFGNYLMFGVQDNAGGADREPWVSDGTAAGTHRLKDINAGGNGSQFGEKAIFFKGKVYGAANDGNHGEELWVTDFSEAGTRLLKDINPGDYSSLSAPEGFVVLGDHFYFKAYQTDSGWALWKSDGTESGTVMIKDIDETDNEWFPSPIGQIVAHDNKVYFTGKTSTDNALWVTDGTMEGTVVVKQFGSTEALDTGFLIVKNQLLFATNSESSTDKLWKSDGTEQGTTAVKEFYSSGYINGINWSVDKTLPFVTVRYNSNNEIWTTDTTAAGTIRLN